MKTKLVVVISSAFLFASTIAFLKYHPQLIFNTHRTEFKDEPLISGFELIKYDAGKKFFTLNAAQFYMRDKKVKYFGFRVPFGKSTELETVEVSFFKDELPLSHLNSKLAKIDMKTKNMVFENRPVLLTEDKRILSAEKISWDDSQRRLLAEGKCFLGVDGKSYSASRIDTDIELKNFQITGQEEIKAD